MIIQDACHHGPLDSCRECDPACTKIARALGRVLGWTDDRIDRMIQDILARRRTRRCWH